MSEVLFLSDSVLELLEQYRRIRAQHGSDVDVRSYANELLEEDLEKRVGQMYESQAKPFLMEYRERRLAELRAFFGEDRLDSVVEYRHSGVAPHKEFSSFTLMEYKRELLEALLEMQLRVEEQTWVEPLEFGVPLYGDDGELVCVVGESREFSPAAVSWKHVRRGVIELIARVLEEYTGEREEFNLDCAYVALNTDALFLDEGAIRQYSPWDAF